MADKKIVGWNIFFELEDEEGNLTLEAWDISNYIANLIDEDFEELLQSQSFEAESKTLDYTGNFSGSHDGVDYDVSYECSHDIDTSYEAEIRDYVEAQISNGYDSGYESFVMSTGFYEGEIEIEGTVTWESSETFDAEDDEAVFFTAREFVSALYEADVSLYEQALDTVADHYDRIGTWDSTEDGRMILLVEDHLQAETGYTPEGPRPFYGNPRKLALDRWGNRRFIRRRKDGTYMKNVDVGRSLAMETN